MQQSIQTFFFQNKTWKIGLMLLCLSTLSVPAQQLDMTKFKGIKPRAIGPAGMSGRITTIQALERDPDIIYAGAASGGLWRSDDGGIAWKPIFEKEKVASVGALAIDQNNPDVIWLGTGEGNPRNSHTGGYGIYKSIDGGKNWQLMGLEKTRCIHRILIHKNNPDIVYVAAIGSPWGEHPERGVYKTSDGGKTWKKVLYVNEKTGAADLVIDPQNPNKLIAAMWEHRRYPWFFNSGGEGSGIYVSYDAGENWEKRTSENGLPEGNLGRVGLAIAPSRPDLVYAIVEAKKNGIYKSKDGGFQWEKVTDQGEFGNRPFYYSEIYVDPQNENRIYSLWSYVSRSEDGGKTWEVIADYGNRVHPDHHAFWIDPNDPQFLIDGNDGGLFLSRDGGESWKFAENIPVGQFYHVNVDMQHPYNVYGGMQDNGSWRGPAYVWRANGIRNAYWQEIMFGDGFDAVPDPSNEDYSYAMSQQGYLGRVHLPTGEVKLIQPVHPEGVKLRFNWNAGIATDPFDKKTVYFGSQFLHKSTDRGNTWEIISPDLTTNDPEKQKQLESGGITYDVTGAENFTTIVSIAPSPVEKDIIWVGTDDGHLQITQNGGESWKNVVANVKGVPAGTWVTQIKASTYKAGEAFVVFDNHRRDDIKPYVYQTQDFGKTWKRLADESQVWGHALALAQDPVEPKLFFLGTEFGLYVSIDGGKQWTQWTNGYPTVSTMDLVIHPREYDLVIGTFGRAFYVLDDIRPLRELVQQGIALMDKPLHAFAPPEAVLANVQQASGTRFSAQGMFQGENRPYGAMISYAVKEVKMQEKKKESEAETENSSPSRARSGTMALEEENKTDETPKDTLKMKVEILNASGEIVRTLQTTPKPGLNRMHWELERKAVRFPGQKKPKPDAPERGGAAILPGTYTVRLSYGEDRDSTQIKVVGDPRMPINMTDMQAKNKLILQIEESIRASTEAVDRLQEAQETTKMVVKQLEGEDEATKELKQEAKAIQKQIKEMLERINGKEDVQGIFRNPDELGSKLRSAYGYIQSTWEAPNEAQKLKVAQAEADAKEILAQINDFFEQDWLAFQKSVQSSPFSLFKKYDPIKIR